MSAEHCYSKRSLSQTTDDESTKKTFDKDYFSERGSQRKAPIRKPKFLSRRQIMFRYMEKVDNINKKLKDLQKIKKVKKQLAADAKYEPRASSLLQISNTLKIIAIDNQFVSKDSQMKGLLDEFYQLVHRV